MEIDSITCEVTLTNTSFIDSCTYILNDHQWNIITGGNLYTYFGNQINLPTFASGEAAVCLEIVGIGYTDRFDCHPTLCDTIELPECDCNGNCGNVKVIKNIFQQFDPTADPCAAEIDLLLSHLIGDSIRINGITSPDGQVLDFNRINKKSKSSRYSLNFRPNPTWQGGEACFKLYLNVNGTDCCLEFCVEIPSCEPEGAGEFRIKTTSADTLLQEIKVYPNPTKGSLYIAWKQINSKEALNISLINYSGQPVLQKQVNAPTALEELNINNFAEGIYVLQLQQGNVVIYKKIIILK